MGGAAEGLQTGTERTDAAANIGAQSLAIPDGQGVSAETVAINANRAANFATWNGGQTGDYRGAEASEPGENSGEKQIEADGSAPASDILTEKYVTASGREIEFQFPKEGMYAPDLSDKDKGLLESNQKALLESLSHLKQGEFPRLAFHGTDEAGMKFIMETKSSQDRMNHAPDGELWTSMSREEGTDPKTYLNDLQQAMAQSFRGQMAVIDAGEAGNWTKSVPGFPSRVTGMAPWGVGLKEATEAVIGPKSERIGKNSFGFKPENFDQRVLGFVDWSQLHSKPPETPRNVHAEAFDIQMATVRTLELAGLLNRK